MEFVCGIRPKYLERRLTCRLGRRYDLRVLDCRRLVERLIGKCVGQSKQFQPLLIGGYPKKRSHEA
jgi:hypothetical protein